ncbi:hypothetical protein AJ80_01872 [Polytolypa hystricis UAMH7299]|uniref:Bacteriophage T5 Orf172 DNA-binding domain-containing protein n=1 Tax=Polytolypa hystricis (strain UAMH7299) TaxID=1447883 RepID=A0A2B7YQT6_POLH7|nr:hypothetical protein AJ80_01872 [Polytolypa hystricis UAMH7299]
MASEKQQKSRKSRALSALDSDLTALSSQHLSPGQQRYALRRRTRSQSREPDAKAPKQTPSTPKSHQTQKPTKRAKPDSEYIPRNTDIAGTPSLPRSLIKITRSSSRPSRTLPDHIASDDESESEGPTEVLSETSESEDELEADYGYETSSTTPESSSSDSILFEAVSSDVTPPSSPPNLISDSRTRSREKTCRDSPSPPCTPSPMGYRGGVVSQTLAKADMYTEVEDEKHTASDSASDDYFERPDSLDMSLEMIDFEIASSLLGRQKLETCKGIAYVFSQKETPKYIKIGSTKQSTKMRIRQISPKNAPGTLKFEPPKDLQKFWHYKTVETLLHIEFCNQRYHSFYGDDKHHRPNGEGYTEWFKIDVKLANDAIDRWMDWILQCQPYDEENKLAGYWRDLIDNREAFLREKHGDIARRWAALLTPPTRLQLQRYRLKCLKSWLWQCQKKFLKGLTPLSILLLKDIFWCHADIPITGVVLLALFLINGVVICFFDM